MNASTDIQPSRHALLPCVYTEVLLAGMTDSWDLYLGHLDQYHSENAREKKIRMPKKEIIESFKLFDLPSHEFHVLL